MKRALLVLVLLFLLTSRASAQDWSVAPTFNPTIEQAQINSYTTIYRVIDGNSVCYWVDGFNEAGLYCLRFEKVPPPTSYSPMIGNP